MKIIDLLIKAERLEQKVLDRIECLELLSKKSIKGSTIDGLLKRIDTEKIELNKLKEMYYSNTIKELIDLTLSDLEELEKFLNTSVII